MDPVTRHIFGANTWKQEAKFPRDFGVDTLAGVLGVDPPSFGGRGRGRGGGGGGGRGGGGGAAAVEGERKLVLAFLEKWKAFDWTSELDGKPVDSTILCAATTGCRAVVRFDKSTAFEVTGRKLGVWSIVSCASFGPEGERVCWWV